MAAVTCGSDDRKIEKENDIMNQGVQYFLDSGLCLNKLPVKYVFPAEERPSGSKSTAESIPCIDLSGLQKSCQERSAVILAISEACSDWGFFRVINHGIDESLIRQMMEVTEEFFSQPHEEKMKHNTKNILTPVRYGTSFNSEVDQVFCWRDFIKHFCYPDFHAPENPPSYRAVAEEYFGEVRKLALKLMDAMTESLELDPTEDTLLTVGFQIAVSNLYPKCPQPDMTFGFPPHSDYGFLTILMDNQVQGLEIHREDSWVQVPSLANSFLVNVGDQLEILSNGRYKSVEHRAVANSEKTRISVLAGHGPDLDAMVSPAAHGDVPAKYKSMKFRDYIMLQQSSEIKGKSKVDLVKV